MEYQIDKRVIDFLKKPSARKWFTASAIITDLTLDMEPETLEKSLLDHYNITEGKIIRYSVLPAKKDLEVLWGHVARVGERELFGIYKNDEAIRLNELDTDIRKTLFISHSFGDSKRVIELAKYLAENQIYCWLAETDILQMSHINNDVIKAISETPYFGIFITENIFNSTWSAKEISYALGNNKSMIAFVESSDENFIHKVFNANTEDQFGLSITAKEIYREFFDNNNNVKWLSYPYINYNEHDAANWDWVIKMLASSDRDT